MSLINDALKRARMEALRQEEDGPRVDYRAVPAHSRRSDRQRQLLVAGWVVAAFASGLVLWLWLRPPADDGRSVLRQRTGAASVPAMTEVAPPASGGTAAVAEPAAGDPAEPASPPAVESSSEAAQPTAEGDAGRPNRPVAERVAATAVGEPVGGTTATAPVESGSDAGAGTTPSPTDGSTGPAPRHLTTSRLEPGTVYLRRVRAAEGSIAELGGIAYSETRPIAVINGSVVSSGDFIAGFTVISIEPERVELEADGVRIFLALH